MAETPEQLPVKAAKELALPPAVDVELPEPMVTDEDAKRALAEMGLVKIGANYLKRLTQMGVLVKKNGVIRNQRGQAFLLQATASEALTTLTALISEAAGTKEKLKTRINNVCQLTQQLSHVTARMTDAQMVSLEIEKMTKPRGVPPPEEEQDLVPSFVPGSAIRPNSTLVVGREIHLHNQAQTQTEPKAAA